MVSIESWVFHTPGQAMAWRQRREDPVSGEVVVQVAGCGICHTDLGFYYEGVPTRHPLPLTLGHEISGTVVAAGAGASEWVGRPVVVPAVLPCGSCAACDAGRGSICPRQVFPGCDVNGGFGTHVTVPARGLCPVPSLGEQSVSLADLAVVADAVTTPYQAILRSHMRAGDLAIFVGAGGVGGFGVQIAAALGAHTIAIDIDPERLSKLAQHGAALTLRSDELDVKAIRSAVSAFARDRNIPTWRFKIFETSGHTRGQALAFDLIRHGSYLSIVGYTADKVEVRLANLMALDAKAEGNWGCLPEHYPAALDLVLSGKIALAPFVEHRPMSTINSVFEELKEHRIRRRIILDPGR